MNKKANHELLANKMDEAEVITRKIGTDLNAYNEEKTDWKKSSFCEGFK